ncbi:uncharacterized protein LOC129941414 [Eupeodes corollae]|uniref:uncharacterized protein LOC129941414 n=1 Tax=Eupeodes corollae TaxID=290404 RepID=UPI00248FF2BC|nr:uncharacterized protein LOC129941414 [Eupeodes corollae]
MANCDFQKPGPLLLDGNVKENWRKFNNMWKIYTVATKTNTESEAIQTARFLSCAGEKAIEIFQTLPLAESNKTKINEVIEAFEAYCMPRSNVVYERYIFFSRNQKEGEPFEQFLSDIIKLAESCDFDCQKEDMIRDRIVMGIAEQNIRLQLLKTDNLDLTKAKELCRVAEQASMQAQQIFPNNVTKRRDHLTSEEQRPSSSGKNINIIGCDKCKRNHIPNRCPAFGQRCLRCGKYNHFALACRFKSVNDINSNEITHEDDEDDSYIDSVEVVGFSSVGDIYSINQVRQSCRSWYENIAVENSLIKFKLDSGADVNVIPLKEVQKLNLEHKIRQVRTKLEAYGGSYIPTKGLVSLQVQYKNKIVDADFMVVGCDSKPLLGLSSCVDLGLIQRVNEVSNIGEFIHKNNDVFSGDGRFPDKCSLELKPDSYSVSKPPRRIPIGIRQKVREALETMECRGIISKRDQPSAWSHQLVVVEKANGSLRLCLDPSALNMNLKDEHFIIPTLDDFCDAMRELNLPGTFVYIDDVIVGGKTKKEHDENVERVLKRAREVNVKFNRDKLQLCVNKVRYLGHVFTGDTICPDPSRVEAIINLKEPQDRKQLESVMGNC